MKIRVLINNIQDKTVINTGLEMVKNGLSSINIPFSINTQDISKTFTGTQFNNQAVGKGCCPNPNEILSVVDGSDDIAFLIYDWDDITPKPTNPCQSPIKKSNTTPCSMPIQWFKEFPEVFYSYFLHELCHAQFYLNNNVSNDTTHLLNNRNINPVEYDKWVKAKDGDYYLYLLSKMSYTKPIVTITREKSTPRETMGSLIAKNNGLTFQCKTLELPWLNNLTNISCIPTGEYNVKWTWSFRFMRFTYEIQNVPKRTGIRIHYGNYYKNFQGCIGLGNGFKDLDGDLEQDITMTKVTVGAFEQFMGRKEFKLIIN